MGLGGSGKYRGFKGRHGTAPWVLPGAGVYFYVLNHSATDVWGPLGTSFRAGQRPHYPVTPPTPMLQGWVPWRPPEVRHAPSTCPWAV